MTMIAHSAERIRLSRLSRRMLLSTRLIGRTCSTPAQSGHPVEMDPQGKVQMRREEAQLGAAQHEEVDPAGRGAARGGAAVSERVLSNSSLASRNTDTPSGVVPMVTPARRGPTAAPPTVSARLPVIHG